jgi:hypothetical protein
VVLLFWKCNEIVDLPKFILAIDSKLRGCDIVALKVEDAENTANALDLTISDKLLPVVHPMERNSNRWFGRRR